MCSSDQTPKRTSAAATFRGNRRLLSRKGSSAGINQSNSQGLFELSVKSLSAEAAIEMLERQIKDLFMTYDFLHEGTLSKDVFFYVLGLATALSSDSSTLKLPPLEVKGPRAVHEAPTLRRRNSLPILRPLRQSPVSSVVWERFAVADRMDLHAFQRWFLESHPVEGDFNKTRQQLQPITSSIRELRLLLSRPHTESWKTFDVAVKSAKQLRDSKPFESVHMLEEAIKRAQELVIPGVLDHQTLLDSWKQEHRQALANSLMGACTLKDLKNALHMAETCPVQLEADVMRPFQEQLLSWQKPFMLHVGTIAGSEATIQVNRAETVAAVLECVSKELEVKTYRLSLASTTRNWKLEPPSATLEELGICADEELLAFFGQLNRWEELSISEFLDLASCLGVLEVDEAAKQKKKLGSGFLNRKDVQTQALIAKIESKEKALHEEEQRRKKRAEEERQRRELIRNELVARASEGYGQIETELNLQWEQVFQEAQLMKSDVQADLDEALPELYAAIAKLECVRKQDVAELLYLINPPRAVRLTMQALCILFEIHPCHVKDESGKIVEDYWQPAMQLLSESGLLQSMLGFDKDNIPELVVHRLSLVLHYDDLSPDVCCKCSVFCAAVCAWVRSIFKYHFIARAVAPKMAHLRVKELELEQSAAKRSILTALMKEAGATS